MIMLKSYCISWSWWTHDVANNKVGYYAALRPGLNVADQIVQSIISKKVVFSVLNISSDIKDTGELYQAKFQNVFGQDGLAQ